MALQCSIVNAATFGVPRGGPRSAMNASLVGCTLPASSVARLCKIAVPPSQSHGIRKRVNALLRTGACNAASAQLLPPSAEIDAAIPGKGNAGDLVEAGPLHAQPRRRVCDEGFDLLRE